MGLLEGRLDGFRDGCMVVGFFEGFLDGAVVGFLEGFLEGIRVGFLEGIRVGFLDGFLLGDNDGTDGDCVDPLGTHMHK